MKEVKRCRKCGSDKSIVTDSRLNEDGLIVRRRKCPVCDNRWMTVEVDYWEWMHLAEKR